MEVAKVVCRMYRFCSNQVSLRGRCRLMKKVRVFGVIGLAPTAVGLAFPTANAMAATIHSPKNADKTVSIERARTPLITCASHHSKSAASVKNGIEFVGNIIYSGQCVHVQTAVLRLKHLQTGLAERVRYYSGGGARIRQTYVGGGESGASIQYFSYPNTYAHQVCEAIVPNNNHNDVKYGPLCETT